MRRALWMVLATVGGCSAEPPSPSGRLERPGEMAYVARGGDRADLLIVDAEAQGVRVLQYEGAEFTAAGETFVRGASAYAPLAISTP